MSIAADALGNEKETNSPFIFKWLPGLCPSRVRRTTPCLFAWLVWLL